MNHPSNTAADIHQHQCLLAEVHSLYAAQGTFLAIKIHFVPKLQVLRGLRWREELFVVFYDPVRWWSTCGSCHWPQCKSKEIKSSLSIPMSQLFYCISACIDDHMHTNLSGSLQRYRPGGHSWQCCWLLRTVYCCKAQAGIKSPHQVKSHNKRVVILQEMKYNWVHLVPERVSFLFLNKYRDCVENYRYAH